MILVRDVFRLKFGKAKEAIAAWKEMLPIMQKSGTGRSSTRVMTDLVGNYYTMVMENTYESLEEFGKAHSGTTTTGDWQKLYHTRFVPLVESGYREIFTIIE